MSVETSTTLVNPELTPEELTQAADYLMGTREALAQAVAGLSSEQWTFCPGPDCWSIVQIVEHVSIVESRVHAVIHTIGQGAEVPEGFDRDAVEQQIRRDIPVRSSKVKAPPAGEPTGRYSGPETLAKFVQARTRSVELLAGPGLRGRVLPHPIFGPWEGYHWLLGAAAHSARHTDQIREVKELGNFA